MSYFFYKLIPPRSTFPADMTPKEAELMQRHAASLADGDPVVAAGIGFHYEVHPMMSLVLASPKA